MEKKVHEIKVISECFVRPQTEIEVAKQRYHLGPLDLAMLSIGPIQKGLLFRSGAESIQLLLESCSFTDRLRQALSAALVHFYPLAGRFETIKYEDEHACFIFLDCIKGPGARLIHATVDLSVSDIMSSNTDVHPAVRSFFDLGEKMVNYDGHTRALLSVQVTQLVDGVFIGFTVNHCVVDGTSFTHFITTLSHIFTSQKEGENENLTHISPAPLYKMFVPNGYGSVFKLPYLDPDEFVTRYDPGPLRERIFHFSTKSMARLKAKANEECGTQDMLISSFMALSGLVWRSITQARNPVGHEDTACFMLLNTRFRLDPPLSDNYVGNFLGQVKGVCKVEELLGQSLGWAAVVLANEVRKNARVEEAMGLLKMFVDRPYVVPPRQEQADFYGATHSVVIGGSPRFDMYGPEFGLGRAVAVRMGFANKDNAKVTANPGREGGGSVDLEICLRPEIMKALEEDEEFMSFVSFEEDDRVLM